MKIKTIIAIAFISLNCTFATAQSIDPTATYSDSIESIKTLRPGEGYSGSAPLEVKFEANPSDDSGWNANYEWRFYTEDNMTTPYLIRYEQDTEYTFNTAGSHRIVCYAVFTKGNDRVEYTDEYWSQEVRPISISISESKLEMPNAFSPNNGDDINNIYKAKKGYKSIVEFRAIIFNRWGKKLYEWHDPAGGWDGTYNGKDVPQGVYFVLVEAKGADGRKFRIKKDVNLLRGYTEGTSTLTE